MGKQSGLVITNVWRTAAGARIRRVADTSRYLEQEALRTYV